MIDINPNIKINLNDLTFSFVRSSGPGGQNVNKVSTAVQLRFDISNSQDLVEEVKTKLIKLAGKKVTSKGVLIIEAKRFRTQDKNKQDAIIRLIKLIQKAAVKDKPRKKTKPTLAGSEKRIENKKKKSQIKKQRNSYDGDY